MAKSNEERLDEAVAALSGPLRAIAGSDLRGIEVDFQGSGECPYRIHVQGETYPLVGLAREPEESDDTSKTGQRSATRRDGL